MSSRLGIVSDGKNMQGNNYSLPVSFLVDRAGIVRYISALDDPCVLSADRIGDVLKSLGPGAHAAPSAA